MANTENVKLKVLIPKFSHTDSVRVEGFVTAGFPSPAGDYIESELSFSDLFEHHKSSVFYVRVSGNSMINASIHDGDILVVDKSLNPKDDSILVCFIDGEFTVKKVSKIEGAYYLMPENPQFKPIKIDECSDFRLWGVVTYGIHKFR